MASEGIYTRCFFFEIPVPILIFSPAPIRLIAFFLLVFFQILIMITGNYAFFNTLTITMCVPLLPDPYLSWLLPFVHIPPVSENVILSNFLSTVAIFLIACNILIFVSRFITLEFLTPFYRFLLYYRLVNPYGLFVHMTRKRDEIIVEGSEDGRLWIPYTFKWKPCDPLRGLKYVAPHQPRLDWQMWFAALGTFNNNPWFGNFLVRLLQGSPTVLALLEKNPFPYQPPKYVRGNLYNYHFSDLKTKKQTGAWWVREYEGPYCHSMALQEEKKQFEPPSTTFTYF